MNSLFTANFLLEIRAATEDGGSQMSRLGSVSDFIVASHGSSILAPDEKSLVDNNDSTSQASDDTRVYISGSTLISLTTPPKNVGEAENSEVLATPLQAFSASNDMLQREVRLYAGARDLSTGFSGDSNPSPDSLCVPSIGFGGGQNLLRPGAQSSTSINSDLEASYPEFCRAMPCETAFEKTSDPMIAGGPNRTESKRTPCPSFVVMIY